MLTYLELRPHVLEFGHLVPVRPRGHRQQEVRHEYAQKNHSVYVFVEPLPGLQGEQQPLSEHGGDKNSFDQEDDVGVDGRARYPTEGLQQKTLGI